MNPSQKISDAIKNAMRAGDKVRLESLRYLLGQMQNAQIDKGLNAVLTEDEFLKIVRKIIKNSEEAIEQYKQGNRQDLVDDETAKTNILRELLPQAMSPEELRTLVEKIHQENPTLAMGPLTGLVLKAAAGRADGRQVNEILREILA
jgi:uncharacterized protein YqeY